MFSQTVVLSVRALMQTSAFTGLAANELQGLRWTDIDLYAGTVTVSNTGYRNALQDETKTEYRQRTVPIQAAQAVARMESEVPQRRLGFP